MAGGQSVVPGGAADKPQLLGIRETLSRELQSIEKRRLIDALEHCAGNQTRAAEHLGMSRRTFIKRLDAYDIPRPRKQRSRKQR